MRMCSTISGSAMVSPMPASSLINSLTRWKKSGTQAPSAIFRFFVLWFSESPRRQCQLEQLELLPRQEARTGSQRDRLALGPRLAGSHVDRSNGPPGWHLYFNTHNLIVLFV